MTSGRRGLRGLTVQAACALSEEFFGFPGADGRTVVPIDQAQVFVSGRVDLWNSWQTQRNEVRSLVGRLVRIRHNDLASPRRFMEAAWGLRGDPDCAYEVPADVSYGAVSHVIARHGQRPLDLARSLVDEAESKHRQGRRLLPVATPGRWSFGWRGESIVDLPTTAAVASVSAISVRTAPPVPSVHITKDELLALASELAESGRSSPLWQRDVVQSLFDKLKDADDRNVAELALNAGGVRLLNAPTGVGKSVLTRLLALHLAKRGVRVAIVVGTIDEALNTAERIQGEEQNARIMAAEIRQDLNGMTLPRRCVALVAPRRLEEFAVRAADHEQWTRFDQLAYGCALSACMKDGPPPAAAHEPCTELRPVKVSENLDESHGEGLANGKLHVCPWLTECGRHRGIRDAADADIIVTNHHNLIHGSIRVPLSIDGAAQGHTSVLEFLLRHCAVVIVDEIDLFQSNMFESSGRHLVLAANGGPQDLPLVQLDAQRTLLLPAQDREVVPALSRTRFLADQFLNYVLEGDLWLEADPERPNSGWHVPGCNDRMLLEALFGVAGSDEPVPREMYEQFNALFPDSRETMPGDAADDLRTAAALLRSVVSNDEGQDRLREVIHNLHRTLGARLPDAAWRRNVVNALLVRTWLGSLHQALTRLTFAVSSPGSDLPAARVLAEKLGTFVQHATIPFGPLGYLLFGFRVDRSGDVRPRARLSVQAIGGDPHTTTAQLGGTVALSTAGTERIVLGLSATAYFPGAAREHVRAAVTYAITDADPGAVTTLAGKALDEEFRPITIAGMPESQKPEAIRELGSLLWDQQLDPHLRRVAETDPERELCLLVGNSYTHAMLLAAGISQRASDPSWVAVVVPKDERRLDVALPAGVVRVTIDELEALPIHHPAVKVCTAPLSLVARGLNILSPESERSAIASIWVCVRPVAQLSDPAEMLASINSHALERGVPGPDPAATLREQRHAAQSRLFTLLASDPRFSRMKRELKAEVIAGILVDLNQLAGRARRGGTSVSLYLVDNAFHDTRLGSDLPSLLRFYYSARDSHQQEALRRIYGSALISWFAFAGIAGKS